MIRQNCPKIASREAKPSPLASLERNPFYEFGAFIRRRIMVRPPPNSGDRTTPEPVEGISTALGSRAVVLLDIIGRDSSCGLIGNGKVIRQHCPRVSPGEANRHTP